MKITVKPCQLAPTNFQLGDVLLERATGSQFAITDYLEGMVYLRKLEDEEKSNPQFLNGTVVVFDESDFREPGNAEPDPVTIVSQIQGEYDDKDDPEDFYGNNFIPGLS